MCQVLVQGRGYISFYFHQCLSAEDNLYPTPTARGHLTVSGDIFGGYSGRLGAAVGIICVAARDAAKHPMRRTAPVTVMQPQMSVLPRLETPAFASVAHRGECYHDGHFTVRNQSFRNWTFRWHLQLPPPTHMVSSRHLPHNFPVHDVELDAQGLTG